jgi:hypothetical protein
MECDYCSHEMIECDDRPADAPYDEREFQCIMWEPESQHTRGWFKVNLID